MREVIDIHSRRRRRSSSEPGLVETPATEDVHHVLNVSIAVWLKM